MPEGDANRVRSYATHLVENARREAKTCITLRAGNIHDALSLRQAHANVCQAIEGVQFHRQAGVELVGYRGVDSRRGANSYFVFRILHSAGEPPETESKEDIIEKLTERIDELTQDEFESIVRAYAKAKGFSNVELSLVLRLKE